MIKSSKMNNSESFKEVKSAGFGGEKAGKCWNNIENEVAVDVIARNLLEMFMTLSFLNKIQNNLNEENNVKSQLDLVKSIALFLNVWTCTVFPICTINFTASWRFAPFINSWKNQNKRSYEKGVDDYQSNHEVPNLTECSISVN